MNSETSCASPPRRPVEWPTVGLGLVIYASWMTLTYHHNDMPLWAVLPLGTWIVAWHGSFQHEAVHGHPFRDRRANTLFAAWPLWLWLPYGMYRESHLLHHRDPFLTLPQRDPESFYFDPARWRRLPRPIRALLWVHQTLLGRLLLGPLVSLVGLVHGELGRVLRGDQRPLRHLLPHALSVALILLWVLQVAHIPLWEYLLCYAYPGTSLTLLRSFAEHRPDPDPARRTAITEAGPLFSLLFLHNNLHTLHHQRPRLPWYLLPRLYRADREVLSREAGQVFRRGYLEQVLRFAWVPKDAPVHPFPEAPHRAPRGGLP